MCDKNCEGCQTCIRKGYNIGKCDFCPSLRCEECLNMCRMCDSVLCELHFENSSTCKDCIIFLSSRSSKN